MCLSSFPARSSDMPVVTSPLMLTRWRTRSLLGFLNISVTGEENVTRRVPSCCSESNSSAAVDPRAPAETRSRLSQCHMEQTRYSRSPGRQGTTTDLPTFGTDQRCRRTAAAIEMPFAGGSS